MCETCEEPIGHGDDGPYCDACEPGPPTTCPICDEPWGKCPHHKDHAIAHLRAKLTEAEAKLAEMKEERDSVERVGDSQILMLDEMHKKAQATITERDREIERLRAQSRANLITAGTSGDGTVGGAAAEILTLERERDAANERAEELEKLARGQCEAKVRAQEKVAEAEAYNARLRGDYLRLHDGIMAHLRQPQPAPRESPSTCTAELNPTTTTPCGKRRPCADHESPTGLCASCDYYGERNGDPADAACMANEVAVVTTATQTCDKWRSASVGGETPAPTITADEAREARRVKFNPADISNTEGYDPTGEASANYLEECCKRCMGDGLEPEKAPVVEIDFEACWNKAYDGYTDPALADDRASIVAEAVEQALREYHRQQERREKGEG